MLTEIRERLIDTGAFISVEIAEDVDALVARAGMVETGSVIVMPFRERANPNALASGGHRQRVVVQFLTGIVLRNYDAMGAERAVAFDDLKAATELALAGWEPAAPFEPCELVGGESSPISKGVSIFVQTWETARFLTGVAP